MFAAVPAGQVQTPASNQLAALHHEAASNAHNALPLFMEIPSGISESTMF
jgi:hypothetical protein